MAPPTTPAPIIEPVRPDDLTVQPGGRRLGEILVDANVVSRMQVAAALAESQRGVAKFLGQRLIEAGALSERDLAWAVGRQHSLEAVDLREVTPQPAATKLLDEATARQLVAIPLAVHGETVIVAVAFPATAGILRESIGRPLIIKVAAHSDIVRAIGNSYRALTGVSSQVRVFEAQHSLRREVARLDP
ncbi:MAG: hypothetical protein QOE61_4045, partial [Micromonosporaceae bacterium]|nr:hypothetical protein [Micromonosporaceae bacterium]